MRIDTDIVVTSEDGHTCGVSCHSVKELLHIMQYENIEECLVETFVTGMPMTKTKMTLNEVREWSVLNDRW